MCAYLVLERQLRVQRVAWLGQRPLAVRLCADHGLRHRLIFVLCRLLGSLASCLPPLLPLWGRPCRCEKHGDGAANAACNVHTQSVRLCFAALSKRPAQH